MVESQPRPDWFPIPREGTKGVEGRVLLGRDGLFIANYRSIDQVAAQRRSLPVDR